MSSKQQRTTLQCPNCGSTMTVEYAGELQDKQVVCKSCETAFDVPDNFERVRKIKRTQKGLFRRREVVEEEIHERRSDFAPQQPRFQQSQGQPIVINVPGASLTPSTSTGSSAGCVIGIIILMLAIGGFVGAAVFLAEESNPVSDAVAQVEQAIESSSGINTTSASFTVRENPDRTVNAHERFVDFITFSPDGSRLVSTASNEWVLWDTDSFAQIRRFEYDAFSAEWPTFVNNGEQFVIDHSGTLHFYSSEDGQELRVIETRSGNGTVSPDGTQYAFVRPISEGDLFIMDLATEQTRMFDSLDYYTDALAFTPDGQFLVVGGRDSNFAIYTVATGERSYLGRSGFDRVDEISFKPDSSLYITYEDSIVEFNEVSDAGIPSTVKSWNVDNLEFDDFVSFNEGAIFSPDGNLIAAGDFWGGAKLWDANADEPTLLESLTTDRSIDVLAFSPDGTRLVGGDSNGALYVWDLD